MLCACRCLRVFMCVLYTDERVSSVCDLMCGVVCVVVFVWCMCVMCVLCNTDVCVVCDVLCACVFVRFSWCVWLCVRVVYNMCLCALSVSFVFVCVLQWCDKSLCVDNVWCCMC